MAPSTVFRHACADGHYSSAYSYAEQITTTSTPTNLSPYFAATTALDDAVHRLSEHLSALADTLGPFLVNNSDKGRETGESLPSSSAVEALHATRREVERMEDLVASLRARLVF